MRIQGNMAGQGLPHPEESKRDLSSVKLEPALISSACIKTLLNSLAANMLCRASLEKWHRTGSTRKQLLPQLLCD